MLCRSDPDSNCQLASANPGYVFEFYEALIIDDSPFISDRTGKLIKMAILPIQLFRCIYYLKSFSRCRFAEGATRWGSWTCHFRLALRRWGTLAGIVSVRDGAPGRNLLSIRVQTTAMTASKCSFDRTVLHESWWTGIDLRVSPLIGLYSRITDSPRSRIGPSLADPPNRTSSVSPGCTSDTVYWAYYCSLAAFH